MIIEYCRFGSLRQYIIDKQNDFIDTMDDEYRLKRDAAKTNQTAQPRISSDTGYLKLTPVNDTCVESTTDINDDIATLTTKDLVCYLFQIARGMEFLALRKVGAMCRKCICVRCINEYVLII